MPSNKKPLSDELMSLSEAATIFGLSMEYLRTIARSGRLGARKIGRNWVTTRHDVETYIHTRIKKGAYRDDLKLP